MIRIIKLYVLLSILSLLSACAYQSPIIGSRTDSTLARDAAPLVFRAAMLEANNKNCKSYKITHAMVFETKPTYWIEIWDVSACGQFIPVAVTFIPDKQGGAYFSVTTGTKR